MSRLNIFSWIPTLSTQQSVELNSMNPMWLSDHDISPNLQAWQGKLRGEPLLLQNRKMSVCVLCPGQTYFGWHQPPAVTQASELLVCPRCSANPFSPTGRFLFGLGSKLLAVERRLSESVRRRSLLRFVTSVVNKLPTSSKHQQLSTYRSLHHMRALGLILPVLLLRESNQLESGPTSWPGPT